MPCCLGDLSDNSSSFIESWFVQCSWQSLLYLYQVVYTDPVGPISWALAFFGIFSLLKIWHFHEIWEKCTYSLFSLSVSLRYLNGKENFWLKSYIRATSPANSSKYLEESCDCHKTITVHHFWLLELIELLGCCFSTCCFDDAMLLIEERSRCVFHP